MNRRGFLKSLAAAAALGALGRPLGVNGQALAQDYPDLVAVRGTDAALMYEKAMAALGGLGRFVSKGHKVLIKPNMGWAVPPEAAANTSPELVTAIIKNALALGASKVSVFDNTCDNWRGAYSRSGLEDAAKAAGAEVAPANEEGYFQKVTVNGAEILKTVSLHELYLEADVIINVPVLKHHGGARMTAALKNLMGAVWDRYALHRGGLDQAIPEMHIYKPPTLNIVEARRVMLSGGPRGHGDSRYLSAQMLLASTDPVAVDAASARIISEAGISAPGYIARAAAIGLGTADLEKINIQRLSA
ncbi:MAG: DUF362 domain-containing protein [Deltaproteobacteria bacterium]|jgi:uncharacterized protein (DUF362 family)|nr:DUF362 domain-containing protein [Deltaproteobacteria bacterium]